MAGTSNVNAASGGPPESSTRPEFRKAPTDVNRIPGSAASMKVQERLKADPTLSTSASASTSSAESPTPSRILSSGLRSKTAIQAMQPFLDSSTNADSPIQPTDIQLLTTSILSNQERQRVILYYQEQLIDSQPSLPQLKKALLFLSSSSWGQILEERKLAGKCAYPPCDNASPSTGKMGLGRGKFRINLRNKSVKAVEDLDLGEAGNTYDDLRDYFCSKACYARSEWILRWVLSDKEIGLLDGEPAKGGGALGGKWQKLTSQSVAAGGFELVELLEDIEREHGVHFDNGEQDTKGLLDSVPASTDLVTATRTNAVEAKKEVAGISNLLGDLTIIERTKTNGTPAPSASSTTAAAAATVAASDVKTALPSRTPYTVDVPNTLGQRFNPASTDSAANPTSSATEDDLEDDIETRERELSHILRYASLATGSRRPRRPLTKNSTIQLTSAALPAAAAAGAESARSPAGSQGHRGEVEGDGSADEEEDEPTIDPKQAAEWAEIRRVMNLALDVRREQREQGLLD
ncbi:hypothetical protein EX895_005604 [Sporisorium graminicola]|uniref:RNA polymerase II subunit B1 CTD phosphatase RPAP2 homolog n=1 Tax=Sporisorium graminicola TaxID=280036 RepID=A0A4U7KR27_9BASI|nr:hypothetical protein EX895_005604 [Sporisorium graminicola]TKY85442.1 hypothetical protein EX895_005604 [Sporisorium graminicola]